MYRYGYTSTHKQRWRCRVCGLTTTNSRSDITQRSRYKLFIKWLTTPIRLKEIAQHHKISRQTLYHWFQPFWQQELNKNNKKVFLANKDQLSSSYRPSQTRVLILDATYIKRDYVVLIAKDLNHVLGFGFYSKENYDNWFDFLSKLFPRPHAFSSSSFYPQVIVVDGKQGLIQAIRATFGLKVKIQRCLFHIHLLFRVYLSTKPKTKAGKQLKRLVHQLSKVTTISDMQVWLFKFFLWTVYHRSLLEAKVPIGSKSGRRWRYKHKKLRAAFSLIKNSLPYLFTFLYYPYVPRTTNHVEAGINACLKELIHRHRGLSPTKQKVLITLFLKSKMPKTTRKFT